MQRSLILPFLFCELLLTVTASQGASQFLVDFDNNPTLPVGPSMYTGQGSQVITVPGKVTFSGGTVLGNPTNTPPTLLSFPNVYFTNDGSDLQSAITIDIDPSFQVVGVSGTIADGGLSRSYLASAYNGLQLVAAQNIGHLSAHQATTFSIGANAITRITVQSSTSPTGWNFMIDNIAFTVVPEPSSFLLVAYGFVGNAAVVMRFRARHRK